MMQPWELTRTEAARYLDDIHEEADAFARDRLVLLPVEVVDIGVQHRLEHGKLARLERLYEQTQLPSESLVQKLHRQREKVAVLKERVRIHNENTVGNCHTRALLEAQYLLENYPDIYVQREDYPYVVGTPLQSEYILSHKRAVRKALTDGLPVPTNVLADYPDLQ